ncbi:MAG: hypothetical protein HYR81_00175 [Nitrospirae bacterium]|nr:hypothetical protein [Nitrospirota bacterium]
MGLFTKTKAGLHVGNDYLSFALLESGRGGYQVKASEVIRLPKQTIRHSPGESNILNSEEIKNSLKTLFEKYPGIPSISLSLPDLSSRMILIEVQKALPKENELCQMIKWNMEQKFLTQVGDSRFSHQLISQSDHSFKSPGPNGVPGNKYYFILGTAILKNILSEYQTLPESFHITPKVISNASFNLYNLYHDYISEISEEGNFLFLNRIDHYFTLMVFEKKILRYIRTIGLRAPENGSEEERAVIEEKNNLKIEGEIESSLHYHFKEQEAQSKSDIHLFISGPQAMPAFGPMGEPFKLAIHLLKPDLLDNLNLTGADLLKNEEISLLTPAIAAAGALN